MFVLLKFPKNQDCSRQVRKNTVIFSCCSEASQKRAALEESHRSTAPDWIISCISASDSISHQRQGNCWHWSSTILCSSRQQQQIFLTLWTPLAFSQETDVCVHSHVRANTSTSFLQRSVKVTLITNEISLISAQESVVSWNNVSAMSKISTLLSCFHNVDLFILGETF